MRLVKNFDFLGHTAGNYIFIYAFTHVQYSIIHN